MYDFQIKIILEIWINYDSDWQCGYQCKLDLFYKVIDKNKIKN